MMETRSIPLAPGVGGRSCCFRIYDSVIMTDFDISRCHAMMPSSLFDSVLQRCCQRVLVPLFLSNPHTISFLTTKTQCQYVWYLKWLSDSDNCGMARAGSQLSRQQNIMSITTRRRLYLPLHALQRMRKWHGTWFVNGQIKN